jgi:hypothetical protein
MDKHQKEFLRLLEEARATLLRSSRHLIYRLPSGRNVVSSSTPSSWRAPRQRLSGLKRLLRGEAKVPAPAKQPQPRTLKSDRKRTRVPQANRAPRSDPEFRLVFGRRAPGQVLEQAPEQLRPQSIYDMVAAAESTESWRALNVFGQMRVLRRLAAQMPQFTGFMPVSVRYAVTNLTEIIVLKDYPFFVRRIREKISPAVEAAKRQLYERCTPWRPALVIDDPDQGRLLIEVGSNELFPIRTKIFVVELPVQEGIDCHTTTRYLSKAQTARNHNWDQHFGNDRSARALFYMVHLPSAVRVFHSEPKNDPGERKLSTVTRDVVRDVLKTYHLIASKGHPWKGKEYEQLHPLFRVALGLIEFAIRRSRALFSSDLGADDPAQELQEESDLPVASANGPERLSAKARLP